MQRVEDVIVKPNTEVNRVSPPENVALMTVVKRKALHALLTVALLATLIVVHDDTLVLRKLIGQYNVDVVT